MTEHNLHQRQADTIGEARNATSGNSYAHALLPTDRINHALLKSIGICSIVGSLTGDVLAELGEHDLRHAMWAVTCLLEEVTEIAVNGGTHV